jgi:hypothetical protein
VGLRGPGSRGLGVQVKGIKSERCTVRVPGKISILKKLHKTLAASPGPLRERVRADIWRACTHTVSRGTCEGHIFVYTRRGVDWIEGLGSVGGLRVQG